MTLAPCPSCARHVRATETACPFCARSLPRGLAARVPPAADVRLTRLAAFTFAASVAVGAGAVVVACSGQTDDGGERDSGGVAPMYGEPPSDAAGGDGSDAARDTGGIAPMYGEPADSGGIGPAYGVPVDR